MESSPLGELVKALSLLQQTQHQARLDVQRENQACFGGQEASPEFVVSHQYSSSGYHLYLEDDSTRRPRSVCGALRESGGRLGVAEKGLGHPTAADRKSVV